MSNFVSVVMEKDFCLERFTVVKNEKYYLKTNNGTIRIRLFQDADHKYCSIGFEDMITFMKFIRDEKAILFCNYRCRFKHKTHDDPNCECHIVHVCDMIDYLVKYIDCIFCNDILDHIKCFMEIFYPIITQPSIVYNFSYEVDIINIVTEDSCSDAVKIVFDSLPIKYLNKFIRKCCQRIDTDALLYILKCYKNRLVKHSLGKIDMVGWNFSLKSVLELIVHDDELDSFMIVINEMEDLIDLLMEKHDEHMDDNIKSIIYKHDFREIKNGILIHSLKSDAIKIVSYLLHHDCNVCDIDVDMIKENIVSFDYDIVELLLKELSNNNLLDKIDN